MAYRISWTRVFISVRAFRTSSSLEDKDVEAIADQDATNISSLPYECWKLWIVAGDDTAPMAERDAATAQLIWVR